MPDNGWAEYPVMDLQRRGWLLVEDGNHGESRPRPNEFGSGDWLFIRAADMDGGRVLFESAQRINEVARKRITKGVGAGGDVLLSHKGTVGKLALVPKDSPQFVCSPQTTFWRATDQMRVDRRYLYYFMCSDDFRQQLAARQGETDMAPYVSLTAQRELLVALPPLPLQKSISRVLGALDDKIESNRRMNRTLEELARAMCKSWFVDFDPVVAKAAGKKPVGMSSRTAALFPDRFQDSPLGPIPAGWRVGELSDIARVNDRTRGRDYPHDEIEYIDIASVVVGKLEGTTPYQLSNAPSRAQRLIAHNDTLWSCVRPNRKSYLLVHRPPPNAVASTGFAVLSAKQNASLFIYLWTTSDDFVDYLTANAEGSAYPAVRPDAFLRAKIVIPTAAIVDAFESRALPLFDRIGSNDQQSRSLASLRDSLLPQLMSGELRVQQAKEVLEEIA